jgi:radical SAM/Cys-rich protein
MGVKQRTKSLSVRQSELSNTFYQLKVLNNNVASLPSSDIPSFASTVGYAITPLDIQVLQINIGKLCNQSCAHCHVDAGPDKKEENMDLHTLQQCLDFAIKNKIPTCDITGGAPEMNAHFRWFVEQCTAHDIKVMVRCNLTIIQANEKYHDLPQFFAKHRVHVISSLPYFSKLRTDAQRGDGVFEDSILSLKQLNEVGYGVPDSSLLLDLVYNPSGAFLPGDQSSLEQEFKRQLRSKYGIIFNNLFAITNLPISRFLDYLIESGNYVSYMQALHQAFNPATIEGLMCRYTLSVGWDGYVYDCDFNQMLDMKVDVMYPHISSLNRVELSQRSIVVNQHCYGCTAGAGSSCGGEVI